MALLIACEEAVGGVVPGGKRMAPFASAWYVRYPLVHQEFAVFLFHVRPNVAPLA